MTGWLDDNISSFSSGGFEQDWPHGRRRRPGRAQLVRCARPTTDVQRLREPRGQPDLVHGLRRHQRIGAADSAGVAALVIQAYRSTHRARRRRRRREADHHQHGGDIGAPATSREPGLIDAYKAVLAAESDGTRPETVQTLLEVRTSSTRSPSRDAGDADRHDHQQRCSATHGPRLAAGRSAPYKTLKTVTVDTRQTAAQPAYVDWRASPTITRR